MKGKSPPFPLGRHAVYLFIVTLCVVLISAVLSCPFPFDVTPVSLSCARAQVFAGFLDNARPGETPRFS